MSDMELSYRTTVLDSGNPHYRVRLTIGTPTMGLVRIEWCQARFGQVIPCNWSQVQALAYMNSFIPLRYQVDDAQNMIVRQVVNSDSEWCFQGDTLVETVSGGKPIREIEPGEIVRSHTGNWQEVSKVLITEIKQRHPMIWVKTKYSTIKCTTKHPFYISRNGNKQWVAANSLKAGDSLLYPDKGNDDVLNLNVRCNRGIEGNARRGAKNNRLIGEIPVDRDLARYLGLYLAEGHGNDNGISLTFNNNEVHLHQFVTEIHARVFGRLTTVSQSHSTQLRLNIRNLGHKFLELFGKKARSKKIPVDVFGWSTENRLEFLRGYLEGDGSLQGGRWSMATSSAVLASDLSRLVTSLGLATGPTYAIPATSTYYKGQTICGAGPSYQLALTVKSTQKFLDLLNAECHNGYREMRVLDIEQHKWAGSLKENRVYNLEVKNDNSYIADCAAVHNCLLNEDDTCLPPDAFIRFNEYMRKADIPVVSALYYTKSQPSEPLVYRGRGNSFYGDWKPGDLVWCDGVPTGALLIHASILRKMWDESPEYMVGNQVTRKVFETPAKMWFDPQSGQFQTLVGTSDLYWCDRVMSGDYLKKAGWGKFAEEHMPNPFLVDTAIFARHIDQTGVSFP